MAAPTYGVESYHYNVLAGDSAVHLLVQLSGDNPHDGKPVGKKPYVLSAVLIDGGDNAHETWIPVYRAIKALPTKYDFHNITDPPDPENPEGMTKFDAVIVTHWDEDHHQGLAKLMATDAQETVAAAAREGIKILAKDIQISFFNYDDPTGRDKPRTTLYAPVWDSDGPRKEKTTTRGAPDSRWFRTGAAIGVKFTKKVSPRADIDRLDNVARLRFEGLLGMEFFRGKTLDSGVDGLTSPQALLAKHMNPPLGWLWPLAPGMFCVGAAKQTMPLPATDTSASGVVRVVNTKKEELSPTNASSIHCAIIWPGTPPRVAHYFAGDAEWETEQNIVTWVGKTKVKNVKASHHGAATSFPVSMLKNWDPDNVVVSCGSAHGHPRWELLVYLYYHSRLRSINSLLFGKQVRLLPTCYPYWFGKGGNPPDYVVPIQRRNGKEYSRISTDAFDANADADVKYRKALNELLTALTRRLAFVLGGVNALVEYNKQPQDPKEWRKRVRFLAKVCCERMWRFLSSVTPQYYPEGSHIKGCTSSGPALMANITQERVFYVLVQSRASAGAETAGSYNMREKLIGLPAQGWVEPEHVDKLPDWTVYVLTAQFKGSGPTTVISPVIEEAQMNGNLDEDLNDENENDISGWTDLVPETGPDRAGTVAAAFPSLADEPVPPIPPIPDTGYFYCSVRTVQPPGDPRAATLTGLLDGFVSRLHTAWFGVAAAPTDPNEEVAVLNTDDTYMWLNAVFGLISPPPPAQPSPFTVRGTASTITEATLNLAFAGCQLQLNSSATPWVFGLPQAAPPTIPPTTGTAPLLYADDVLILGLGGTTGPVSPTLQAVCDDLQMPVPAFLADVASTITLQLTPVGEPGHRNALWFSPDMEYRATLRLVFAIQGIDPSTPQPQDPLNSRLFAALHLVVRSAKIIVRKSATFDIVGNDDGTSSAGITRSGQLAFSIEIELQKDNNNKKPEPKAATIDATLIYNFADGSMRVVVLCDPSASLQSYLDWIEGVLHVGITTNVTKYLKLEWVPSPRRVILDLAAGDHAIEQFEIDFEVRAPWGQGVAFLFAFSWTPSQQRMWASIWPAPLDIPYLPAGVTPNMVESFEEYEDLFGPTLPGAAKSIHLADLLPGGLSPSDLGLPSSINPDVFGLSLILTRTVLAPEREELEAEFFGSLGTVAPASATTTAAAVGNDASNFPQIELEFLGLDLRYTVDRSAGPSSASSETAFDLSLNFSIGIWPRPSGPDYGLARLTGYVNYSRADGQSSWQALARVDQLMVGHLVSFFESGSQDGVMALVEHIEIVTLELLYDYAGPGGTGSHFLFDGVLLLGPMRFTLTFEHWTADHDPEWSFSALLQAPDDSKSIGDVISYLTTDVVLPPFIGNIQLLGGDGTSIELDISKQKVDFDGVTTEYIVFQTNIALGDLSMTFIQYNSKGWTGPKRIFRAALSGPLTIASIPVIENLTQPFDELYFLHVQDKSGPNPAGVLRQEFALLNAKLDPGEPPFMFKETHRPGPDGKMKGTDTVIDAGLRFTVVATVNNQPTVVLDHEFASAEPAPGPTPTPPPPAPPQPEPSSASNLAGKDEPGPEPAPEPGPEPDPGTPAAPAPGDSSKAPFHKTIGPLTISNIGLQFKDGTLTILLDATFLLGPISLALLGLALDLDFTQPGATLLSPPHAQGKISGLGFGFEQPPVTIAGLFESHPTDAEPELFLGGVVVTFEPYLFAAAGCYGTLRDGSKMVALFCLLEGPLIELEFAQVTGLCGGFGYDTDLRFPTVDAVASYPLIDHSLIAGSPLDTIEKLLDPNKGCITAREGAVWLAAGLDVNAFKLLGMKAVVAVEFSASDVKLGVFADVQMSFPAPAPPDADPKSPPVAAFAYAELGIVATVDFGAGVMLVQAQLAPSSFVLDPACHLTGGFALGYWFGSNQHAGDWVFTLGGYHPRFTPPTYYPNPPRLAISWTLDDVSLAITGQAYFALTPGVAMGGGELRASLSMSPLYAYFDAYADFLIKFSPFYFIGEAGVDVGVQFTLDLWICTIHINVDIGAQLYLEGPPVHGHAHVDFWVFGFDIYFGDEQPKPDPVLLKDFYYLLKQAETAAPAPPSSGAVKKREAPAGVKENDGDEDTIEDAQQLSCVGGLVTSPNQTQNTAQDDPWPVRAGPFQFRVTSPFASDSAAVTGGGTVTGSGNPIYARPMQNPNSLASVTAIMVTGPEGTVTGCQIDKTISKVPASMWKQYSEDEDPISTKNTNSGNGNQIDSLLDGTQGTLLEHMLSVTVTPPAPYWPGPDVEPLAAFNAADANAENVMGSSTLLPEAWLAPASTAWNPQPQPPQPPPPAGPEDDEWALVPARWAAPAIAPATTVAAFAEAMGWAAADAPAGGAPAELVKDFEAYFMAVPQMTVVSV